MGVTSPIQIGISRPAQGGAKWKGYGKAGLAWEQSTPCVENWGSKTRGELRLVCRVVELLRKRWIEA